jgi:hypothetical protein
MTAPMVGPSLGVWTSTPMTQNSSTFGKRSTRDQTWTSCLARSRPSIGFEPDLAVLSPNTSEDITSSKDVTREWIARRLGGKYPPAEPGALGIGPLEAAVRIADATLHSLAT